MLQCQVMCIFDHLMAEDYGAVKDAVALLAVCLEQTVMDNGRMEVAAVLSLQEDVPSAVFTNRASLATSRSKAFYLKEMDVITAKRLEFVPGGHPTGGGADLDPAVKKQPRPGGRGRGRGKNQQRQEEEEQ